MTLLRSAILTSGDRFDIALRHGLIASIDDPGRGRAEDGEASFDLDGYLLLPAAADPHAHLDKALSADQVANPAGDLLGAIDAWHANYPSLTIDEIAGRARRAALRGLARGYTAIRTHVDVNDRLGLKAVEALLTVRDELVDLIDIQVCGLVATPTSGMDGAGNRKMLRAALELGIDVVGGAPWRDSDPTYCVQFCLDEAAAFGRPIDLHIDETLDDSVLVLRVFARLVAQTGFSRGASASHCVSLGMQTNEIQKEVATEVAAAGISVIANPFTNLYLQSRDRPVAAPRGLTALRPLLTAGVNVAAGCDNVEDPFNILGRADPLEVASLLVLAGHLTPAEAYQAVSGGARHAMGLPPIEFKVGSPADVFAVRAGSLREALASASVDRLVFRRGNMVARTDVAEWITPILPQ